jgi:hypothetical protein
MTDDTTFSAPGTSPVLRCAFGAAIALTCSLVHAAPVGDSKAIRITEDTGYALVQLQGEALTVAEKTKPAPGKKVDFNNGTTKSYRAQLSALRNDYKAWLRCSVPAASISGEFDIALNAVGVRLKRCDPGAGGRDAAGPVGAVPGRLLPQRNRSGSGHHRFGHRRVTPASPKRAMTPGRSSPLP